jgi:hypothetical protein
MTLVSFLPPLLHWHWCYMALVTFYFRNSKEMFHASFLLIFSAVCNPLHHFFLKYLLAMFFMRVLPAAPPLIVLMTLLEYSVWGKLGREGREKSKWC